MLRKTAVLVVWLLLISNKSFAQDSIKIGLLAPMSGPASVVGKEVAAGFTLGLSTSGNTIAGRKIELIVADDQNKPDAARQAAMKLLQHDRVDVVVVGGFSNTLLAEAQPVFAAHKILFSVGPGSSALAGKACNPLFFSMSFQNDDLAAAGGAYMNSRFNTAYFMAPNYQGGRDVYNGFKGHYRGKILREVFSPLSQLDFAAEIAAVAKAKPDAVYFFYPGSQGVNFLKQWSQSGPKDVKLLTHLSLDQTLMPAIGDAALGIDVGTMWTERLKNPENDAFVKSFRKEYGRLPAPFAAIGYDGARLLLAAAQSLGGNMMNTNALKDALLTTPFKSVRGSFRFNKNHFPIQNYYMTEVVKNDDGTYGFVVRDDVFTEHEDSYVNECQMPN